VKEYRIAMTSDGELESVERERERMGERLDPNPNWKIQIEHLAAAAAAAAMFG